MFQATGKTTDALTERGRQLWRKDSKQILLIAAGGTVFAIANRCPHEGYPLSEGTLGPDCVLTCNWHNWKFDLASGTALIGRDPVRTYPVELRGGEIFVDLTDPPAEAQKGRALAGLDAALADNDMPRMAREVARLERAGFDARLALTHGLRTRGIRFETGMTHAQGAAADWLSLSTRAPSDDARLAALLEPLGHLAWDTQGAGEFPYSDAVAEWDADAFVAAMEAEGEAAAVARLRGALWEQIPYGVLRPAFARSALAHYADFGHSAIYTLKSGQLIDHLGDDAKEPVLLALIRQQIQATREERLPEFRNYDAALAAWDGTGTASIQADDLISLSIDAILKRVVASSGRSVREIYDALLGAAAWNLLHFDLGFDRASDNAIADNISWLDFTHALTFANAVRHLCAETPSLWPRGLLQMALFAGRNRAYVKEQEDGAQWQVNDPSAFLAREMVALYDHGIVEPIIACHRVKMLFALEDELKTTPDAPWAGAMCAALNRYLNTPQKRHHGLRNAAQARDFVLREA